MQVSTHNADIRTLPDGWVEHFDSQRKLWYYVDLDSEPPRVALVHPLDSKAQPSSAPGRFSEHGTRTPPIQRPIGPRENASSLSTCIIRPSQRPRRATVAQQLYASSLPIKPMDMPLIGSTISESTSKSSSASNTPVSDDFASSSSTSAVSPPIASLTNVSATSPTSPTHLDVHSPRNFFDCTRLSGTRRVTYSGPQPRVTRTLAPSTSAATRDATAVNAQSFYHPSIRTTPSPNPPTSSLIIPGNEARPSALSTRATQKMKATAITSNEVSSTSSGSTLSPSGLIPTVMPSRLSPSHHKKAYTAIVTADLTLNPNPTADSSSRLPPRLLDVSNVHDGTASIRPLPSIFSQASDGNNISSLSNQAIVQPKPIRPMAGVTLNLQVQVAGITPGSEEPGGEELSATKKKKTPLLKSFGLGLSKNAKGKKPIRTIQDAESMEISPVIDEFDSRMDSSYVLIES